MSASNDEDTIKYKALEGIERPITRLRIRKAKEACSIRWHPYLMMLLTRRSFEPKFRKFLKPNWRFMSLKDKKKFLISLHFVLIKICNNGPWTFGIIFPWIFFLDLRVLFVKSPACGTLMIWPKFAINTSRSMILAWSLQSDLSRENNHPCGALKFIFHPWKWHISYPYHFFCFKPFSLKKVQFWKLKQKHLQNPKPKPNSSLP